MTREELESLIAEHLPVGSGVVIRDVHITVGAEVHIAVSDLRIRLPRDHTREATG